MTKHHFLGDDLAWHPRTPITPENELVASSSITAREVVKREKALAMLPDAE